MPSVTFGTGTDARPTLEIESRQGYDPWVFAVGDGAPEMISGPKSKSEPEQDLALPEYVSAAANQWLRSLRDMGVQAERMLQRDAAVMSDLAEVVSMAHRLVSVALKYNPPAELRQQARSISQFYHRRSVALTTPTGLRCLFAQESARLADLIRRTDPERYDRPKEGPTPETAAKLADDPVQKLFKAGKLSPEQIFAAEDIRHLYRNVVKLIDARSANLEAGAGGGLPKSLDPLGNMPEALHKRYQQIYRPWAETMTFRRWYSFAPIGEPGSEHKTKVFRGAQGVSYFDVIRALLIDGLDFEAAGARYRIPAERCPLILQQGLSDYARRG